VENQIYVKEPDGWRLLGILCVADALDQVRVHERLGGLQGIENVDAAKMTGRIVVYVIFLHQAGYGSVQVGPCLEILDDLVLRQVATEQDEDNFHSMTFIIHGTEGR